MARLESPRLDEFTVPRADTPREPRRNSVVRAGSAVASHAHMLTRISSGALLAAALAVFALPACGAPSVDDTSDDGSALSGPPSTSAGPQEQDVEPGALRKMRTIKDAYLRANELPRVASPPNWAGVRVYTMGELAGIDRPVHVLEFQAVNETTAASLQAASGLVGPLRVVSFETRVPELGWKQEALYGYAVWLQSATNAPPRWVTHSRARNLVEVFRASR